MPDRSRSLDGAKNTCQYGRHVPTQATAIRPPLSLWIGFLRALSETSIEFEQGLGNRPEDVRVPGVPAGFRLGVVCPGRSGRI